ncbi:MAG: DUF6470 family protein [Alicyclobacillus sp.]|nr:DUF6470 family protein [Alicyclobacillus sp.]
MRLIPQIQIHQTFGQIGIRYQRSLWQIHSQQADLSIQAPQAQVDIHTTPAQLDIDQTQAFADEGLRKPLDFVLYRAQLAHQTALQGIADKAYWGQRFMHTEKGDPLGDWAMRYRDKAPQVEMALVPRPFSVHIHYTPGQVTEHVEIQPVHIDATIHRPEVQFQPGAARTYVERAPSLLILTPPIGQLVDTSA